MSAPSPKNMLDRLGIEPKKSLGQNFLQDGGVLDKIAAAADLAPEATVLEIGAGTGGLTVRLARLAQRVVAVEIDRRLEPVLQAALAEHPHVELRFADILETDLAALMGAEPYAVVANVPYYITSAIVRHMLESAHPPTRAVLLVQREVADRMAAKPGDLSLLAVSAQFYAEVRVVGKVAAGSFFPKPDVDSAIVRLDVYPQPRYPVPSTAAFFKVARAGFGKKRKQLKNALSEGLALPAAEAEAVLLRAGVAPTRRAETLTLAEWAALAREFG